LLVGRSGENYPRTTISFYDIPRRDGKGFLMGFYREWNFIEREGYNQGIPWRRI